MTKIENKNRFMRHFFMVIFLWLFLKTDLEFELEFIVRITTYAPERNLLFQLQHYLFCGMLETRLVLV